MIKQFFSKKRQSFDDDDRIEAEEYVELDTTSSHADIDQKVIVRPFVITDFADVKPILESPIG